MKLLGLISLALVLALPGCSRFSTRSGPPPILEPLDSPPPPPASEIVLPKNTGSAPPPAPINREWTPPPAENSWESPGVSLPADTALPTRKKY